jgi:hypothetical protein
MEDEVTISGIKYSIAKTIELKNLNSDTNSLDLVAKLVNLEKLNISYCYKLKSIDQLSALTKLLVFEARCCNFSNLDVLENMG